MLRIHREGQTNDQPHRLVFPREALDLARGNAALRSPQPGAGDLASQIDSTLDEMQRKLDVLKDDAEQIFRFPCPDEDDGPPSTAA
jgi:hypothetical protein